MHNKSRTISTGEGEMGDESNFNSRPCGYDNSQ